MYIEEQDHEMRKDTEEVLNYARDGWIKCNEKLRGMFGADCKIDEMAFLFPNERYLASWVKRFVAQPGYELFNVASDRVITSPIPSEYDVSYWFLRTPFDYRLELMSILDGYSPLHHGVNVRVDKVHDNQIVAVHASFKVRDEKAYASANATLIREGWECAQKCDSTYGRLSYWNYDPFEGWFLKPRVNLRDALGADDA